MKTLSLDTSTTVMAYVIAQGTRITYVGTYYPGNGEWYSRVHAIGTYVDELLTTAGIEMVFIERPTGHHGNVHTHRLLGAVWYEQIIRCELSNMPWIDVTASQVRGTGYHKVARAATERRIQQDLPQYVIPINNGGDIADAVGVYVAGMAQLEKRGTND